MSAKKEYDPFEIASQKLLFKYNNTPRPLREDRYKPKYITGGVSVPSNISTESQYIPLPTADTSSDNQSTRKSRLGFIGADVDSNHPPFKNSIYLTDTDADRPAWLQYVIENSDGPLDDDEDSDAIRTRQDSESGRGKRMLREEDYEAITGIPALEDGYRPRGAPLRRRAHQPKLIPNYPTLTAPETPDTEYSSVVTPFYQSLSRDPGTGRMRTRVEVYELRDQARGMQLARQGKINHDTLDKFYTTKEEKPKDNILWPWSKYYSWNGRRRPPNRAAMMDLTGVDY